MKVRPNRILMKYTRKTILMPKYTNKHESINTNCSVTCNNIKKKKGLYATYLY